MERMASIILWIESIATGTALAFDLLCFPFFIWHCNQTVHVLASNVEAICSCYACYS